MTEGQTRPDKGEAEGKGCRSEVTVRKFEEALRRQRGQSEYREALAE